METNGPTSDGASSSRKGFLGGLVDAFREGMKEADEKEAAETAKQAEVLIEDIDWFKKSLAEIQEPGEVIHFQLEGLDLSGLVCTDRRVIIFHTGHFTWVMGKVKTFLAPYNQITGVSLVVEKLRIQPLLGGGYVFEVVTSEMKAGATVAGSMLEFAAEPNRIAFGKDKKTKLDQAVAFINQHTASTPTSVSAAVAKAPSAAATTNPVQMLEKLAELKASGILTDDEFAEQKKKILERM
jgi:hypothetical protein